jgi:hypothetical protein
VNKLGRKGDPIFLGFFSLSETVNLTFLLPSDLCHRLFPQATGSIDKVKAEGKVKGKRLWISAKPVTNKNSKVAGCWANQVQRVPQKIEEHDLGI